MREYNKALQAIQDATEHDTENQHSKEIQSQEYKIQTEIFTQRGSESQEETYARAMRDPEVAVRPNLCSCFYRVAYCSLPCKQEVMADPVMQQILQQAQTDPGALQDHMKNPVVRSKIQKLINAGIIRTR